MMVYVLGILRGGRWELRHNHKCHVLACGMLRSRAGTDMLPAETHVADVGCLKVHLCLPLCLSSPQNAGQYLGHPQVDWLELVFGGRGLDIVARCLLDA